MTGTAPGHLLSAGEGPSAPARPRRQVVRGAAWAVPAVLLAAAAPSVAASTVAALVGSAGACKLPGHAHGQNKGYQLACTATNPASAPSDLILTVTSFTFDGVPASNVRVVGSGSCQPACGSNPQVCLPRGSTVTFTVTGDDFANSRGGEVRLTYVVLDATTCEPLEPTGHTITALAQHPC